MATKKTDTLYLHATYPHPMVEHLNKILPSLDKSDLERFETKLVRRFKIVFPNEEQEISKLETLGEKHLISGFYECLDKSEREKIAFLTNAVQTLVPLMEEWDILEALESFMYIHEWKMEVYVPRKKKEVKKPEKKKKRPEPKEETEKKEEKEEKKPEVKKKRKTSKDLVEVLENSQQNKITEAVENKKTDIPKEVLPKKEVKTVLFEEQMGMREKKNLKQAQAGNADAQYEMGNFYSEEGSNHIDYKEAQEWYEKSVEQGNVRAKFALAQLYDSGKGTIEDAGKKAFQYYLDLADSGYSTAQCIIGLKYRFGMDVKASDKEAEKWLLKAAVQGNVDAQRHLADLYLYHNKRTEAVRWLKNASGRGDSYCARRLQRIL